jgi:hypothetical protein
MFARHCVRGILFLCLGSTFIGCDNSGLDSIQVSPTTQSLAAGQTAQLTAIGTYGNASHRTTQNITNAVIWTSTVSSVATVSTSGLVTALGAGTTTITARTTAYNGTVSSSATVTVTGSGGGTTSGGTILSLTVIPSSITVGNLQDTGQFLAIGTFSTSPFVRDVTNLPSTTWISSAPNIFPVNSNDPTKSGGNLGASAGIVTAYGIGSGVITVEAKGGDGTLQTATATFTCPAPDVPPKPGQCYQGSQVPSLLATLTVYNEGLNTTNWLVTAPSATGTANVLHCGPGSSAANLGGSVCVATYPVGTTVTLTAPNTGAKFGGGPPTAQIQELSLRPGPTVVRSR